MTADIDNLPEREKAPTVPLDSPLCRGLPANVPVYEQDFQWRLKIQPFTRGGFEAKATLVDRNRLNMMILANQSRGRRLAPKEVDEYKEQANRNKAAFRAAKRVRQLCIEINADRLLTLTSRNLLPDLETTIRTWKRFIAILGRAGIEMRYIAVPERHANGEHFHIHAAISGYVKADLLRRCWQIALGGKGNERKEDALGNIDLKRGRNANNEVRRAAGIARYLSKYITKGYLEHHHFNKKRYWVSRSVKLPEPRGEWLKSENMEDALRELFDRFGPDIMAPTFKENLFIDNTNRPLIFFRWLPGMANIDIPF
jgi:hypothetical protein